MAAENLSPDLYHELKSIARRHLQKSARSAVIDTTMIVHEAWMKLQNADGWQDEQHFKATASTAMRQILIDHARRQSAQKRGGPQIPLTLGAVALPAPDAAADQLLLLDELCAYLKDKSPDLLNLFDLKFFGGLTFAEIATISDKSERTLRRDWARIKGYLGLFMT